METVSNFYQDPPNAIQVEFVEGCNLACSFCGIQYIREKRRGAINEKQIRFLEEYVPSRKGNGCGCVLQ